MSFSKVPNQRVSVVSSVCVCILCRIFLFALNVTQETPGPKIGLILNALFAEVLEDPTKNTVEYLENKAKTLVSCEMPELKELANKGKIGMEEKNAEQVSDIRKQFHVK